MSALNLPNMLERAANVLQSGMERHAGKQIEYERPGVGSVMVDAIVGETEHSQDDQSGLVNRIVQRDYTIRQTDLVIDGQHIGTPNRQDIVRQTLPDGSVYESRVLGEAGNPHYMESDGYGVAWRIHTKRDEV